MHLGSVQTDRAQFQHTRLLGEQEPLNTVQLRIAQQYEVGRTGKKQTKRRSQWHTEAIANLNKERTRLMIVTIPENGLEDKVCHHIDMGLVLRA